ncbi:hypothetical protein PN36_12460 [Candidatus Thiomargarita nelsonii]|uniref:Uncharacterized protein n=1 Tax=Candidatus Thiomargarita nelsonii TaxID=1003181 RepID=A0A0A6PDE0_9GAMM|nr:hypothetical protein PN36_12460 [Candidatus Thiomargarita nelsonii]
MTGSANLDVTSVAEKVAGIKDAEMAAQISEAVIVGSAIVQRIETEPQEKLLETIPAFLRELRLAMDAL